jgi:hypothetical protein
MYFCKMTRAQLSMTLDNNAALKDAGEGEVRVLLEVGCTHV